MAIFVTGDTHLPLDIKKITSKNFDPKGLTKSDYLIICGDFGLIWNRDGMDGEEKWWLKWLNKKPWTTLFVDGNHENFERLAEYVVEEWHGGKVHKISDSVIHLMRGQVFDLDGYKFFTMGGAESHDMYRRRLGKNYWKQELPTMEEYDEALSNLDKYDWNVDYVITHCAPDNIQYRVRPYYRHNMLTNFLFTVDKDLTFKHWYFGHYHVDKEIDDQHTCLFNEVIKLLF